jgi:hypothetical protein
MQITPLAIAVLSRSKPDSSSEPSKTTG